MKEALKHHAEEWDKGWIGWAFAKNDMTQESDWTRQHKLLARKAVRFYNALDPLIREIEKPPEPT